MGREELTAEQQREIGLVVAQARRCGVPWKVLQRVYGRSRTQLWRYCKCFFQDETH